MPYIFTTSNHILQCSILSNVYQTSSTFDLSSAVEHT